MPAEAEKSRRAGVGFSAGNAWTVEMPGDANHGARSTEARVFTPRGPCRPQSSHLAGGGKFIQGDAMPRDLVGEEMDIIFRDACRGISDWAKVDPKCRAWLVRYLNGGPGRLAAFLAAGGTPPPGVRRSPGKPPRMGE